MSEHRVTTTIRLPPDTVGALDCVAAREHRTRSNLVEVLVAEGLTRRGVKLDYGDPEPRAD